MKKVYLILVFLIQMSVLFGQTHFEKGFVGVGTDQMTIVIKDAVNSFGSLQVGDEIAVFDGNLCCGVLVIDTVINPSDSKTFIPLTASSDDGSNNGFLTGNKMYFRFWDSSELKESHNVVPIIKDKDGIDLPNAFAANGTAFVTLSTENTTKTWTDVNDSQTWSDPDNWDPAGVPDPTNDVTIPGGLFRYPSLSAAEATYCGSLAIESGATLTIGSTASGTGSLIAASGVSGAGVVTARHYLLANGWHMISSPISNQSIASFLTNPLNAAIPTKDATSRGMMDYNEITDDWNNYFTNSTLSNVDPGKGYGVRRGSNGAVIFTGSLSSSNISTAISRNNNGWNLIGNPFPSAIYAKQEVNGFLVVNSSEMDPSYQAMYLWDAVADAYTIVNSGEGQSNIASGQGFFIKAKAGGGNVTFTQAMQVHQTDATFKSALVPAPYVVLNAKVGDIYSSTKVNFNEEMTLGLDPSYDAGILRSGKGFDIYSKLVIDNGVDFAIQWLPGNSSDSYIIPIGLDATKGGEVVFSAQSLNLPVNYEVIIEDKLTNSQTNIKNGGLYVANLADGAKGIGRFYLHVGSSVQTGLNEVQKDKVVVYTIDQTLFIKGSVSDNAQINVFSVDGRLVNRFAATSQNLNKMSVAGYAPGVYILNIQDRNGYKPVKFVVE